MKFDNWEEWNDIFYACREAQIRFKRLRTKLYQGENPDFSIWSIDECDGYIAHYKALEDKVAAAEPQR